MPCAFCSRTSSMPVSMACKASSRDMAGQAVKSSVPARTRQFFTPSTGAPAMPISTGITPQCTVSAILQTLVLRCARFCKTARVTSLPDWLMPCAMTPLSAHSTKTARFEKSNCGTPVSAATSSNNGSRLPSPPSGFASDAQCAWAALRAASSGCVIVLSRFLNSVSVIFCPSCCGGRRPQSAAEAACPPNINAENPHKNVRLQKHSPTYGRSALSLCTLCRFR